VNSANKPSSKVNWTDLALWWESGNEEFAQLKTVVSKMIDDAVNTALAEQAQPSLPTGVDGLEPFVQGLGKAVLRELMKRQEEPVGINGLTDAQTRASMSVMGLSNRKGVV
jgi:hypothetical protein